MLAAFLLLDAALGATVHRVGPDGTIAGALAAAAPGDVILVAPGTYAECLDLGALDVRLISAGGETVIDCGGAAEAAIRAEGQPTTALVAGFRVENAGGLGVRLVSSGTRLADLRLEGLSVAVEVTGGAPLLQDLAVTGCGGAESAVVATDADLVVESSVFTENYGEEGGAVRVSGGSLSLVDVKFEGNGATGRGGAVAVDEAPATVVRAQFLANVAGSEGGAVAVDDGRLTARDLVLTANFALNGGAVWARDTEVRLSDVTASGNDGEIGGAVWVRGELVVTGGAFSGNEGVGAGSTWGGAIAVNGDLELHRVSLRSNRAARGGAVHAVGGSVTLVGVESEGNFATYAGGSLLLDASDSPWIASSSFSRDLTDGMGGAVWASVDSGELVIWRTTFQDHAATLGGGVYAANSGPVPLQARLEGSSFSGSTSTSQCAGACFKAFDLEVRGTAFADLEARADGAALLAFGWGGADALIDDTTVRNVDADDGAVHLTTFGTVAISDLRVDDLASDGHGALFVDDADRLAVSRSRFCGITSGGVAAIASEAAYTTVETSVIAEAAGSYIVSMRNGAVHAVTLASTNADSALVHTDGTLSLWGSIIAGSASYAVSSAAGGGLDVWDSLVWGATSAAEGDDEGPLDVTIDDPGLGAAPCDDPRPNASAGSWGATVGADADGDGVPWWDGDCDDDDATVLPGATDVVGDGVDQDCDGTDDEDADGDGEARMPWGDDCDDDDPTVFPGADEDWGDGVDQDCDGRDADADGDGWVDGPDCDDGEVRVHPGAPDVPWDGVDQDCDGHSDWDADRDGLDSVEGGGTDCDDGDPAIPALDEVWYDGIDQDCDGADDYDADGDGFPIASDCDDSDPRVNPAAAEVHNGRDDDCDGRDAAAEPEPEPTRGCDTTGGGAGWLGVVALLALARRVGRASVPALMLTGCPGVEETDEPEPIDTDVVEDTDCGEPIALWADEDGDRFGNPLRGTFACPREGLVDNDSDCDDADFLVNPDAVEVCNGKDDDCDGTESDAPDVVTWHADGDRDGFGNAVAETSCTAPYGTVRNAGDCDDTDPDVHPEAEEVCNGADDDCNGAVDDNAPGDTLWRPDADGDGYGATDGGAAGCRAPTGWTSNGGDCDDEDAGVNPAEFEICADGIDQNCDQVAYLCGAGGLMELGMWGLAARSSAGVAGFGFAVQGRADLDSDGVPDVAVGSPAETSTGAGDDGVVRIWSSGWTGGTTEATAARTIWGSGDALGWALTAGDVDDDGRDELVAGAPASAVGAEDGGAVVLISEGAVVATAWGTTAGAWAGAALAMGDVDGDGAPEVLVGAPSGAPRLAGTARPGAIVVLDGIAEGALDGAWLLGDADGDEAGGALTTIDADGDGLREVVAGARGADSFAGAVWIASSDASSLAEGLRIGGQSGSQAGAAVAAADLDGDGHEDLAVGAPGGAGGVWVFAGPLAESDLSGATAVRAGLLVGDAAGSAVSAAGDVNDDGRADLIVGAPGNSAGGASAGAAYLLYGGFAGSATLEDSDATLLGAAEQSGAGAAVGPAGDLDEDGYADLLIGGPSNAFGSGGQVWIVTGGPGL